MDDFNIKPWRSGLTSEDWAVSSGMKKGAMRMVELLTGESRERGKQ